MHGRHLRLLNPAVPGADVADVLSTRERRSAVTSAVSAVPFRTAFARACSAPLVRRGAAAAAALRVGTWGTPARPHRKPHQPARVHPVQRLPVLLGAILRLRQASLFVLYTYPLNPRYQL